MTAPLKNFPHISVHLLNYINKLILFQDLLEYRRKMRNLRVRMLDGSVKTVLVDDSQPVANLMVVICTKIGKTTALIN